MCVTEFYTSEENYKRLCEQNLAQRARAQQQQQQQSDSSNSVDTPLIIDAEWEEIK